MNTQEKKSIIAIYNELSYNDSSSTKLVTPVKNINAIKMASWKPITIISPIYGNNLPNKINIVKSDASNKIVKSPSIFEADDYSFFGKS